MSVRAQTTYSTQTSNFYSVTQDNNQPPYAGEYNTTDSSLGLYANGGNGNVGNNPQVVNFRPFTTSGSDLTSAAQTLQVGQSFTVTLKLNGGTITGNSIGFSFNNGTAHATVADYSAGSRFEYSFSGGAQNAAIYASGGTAQQSNLPAFAAFAGGLTYTFTLVSTNEFNFTVSSGASYGGTTYNVGALGGTSGAPIGSFALFNRGYNNSDAIYSNISVTNVGTIGLAANSGETKTVTGMITDLTTGSNSVQKSGVGTVRLTNANTFTGTTTVTAGTLQLDATGSLGGGQTTHTSAIAVNNGGTLLFGGTTAVLDRIHNATPLALNGGTLNTAGFSEHGTANNSAGIGALTLQATSTIDLANGASILAFANSANATWTNGAKLNIYNWSGDLAGAGTDQVFFGSDATGLTAAQLMNIEFFSDAGTTDLGFGQILATGEIVPVPEPATWFAGFLMLGSGAYSLRRRLRPAA
ncbi:MAG: autotransporter-associated beta strand repeat-containing protein [Rhodospirillales bacterium]|nr:autotransporter-associated beta strand repeat-containing protein [Acetobacter sp.]